MKRTSNNRKLASGMVVRILSAISVAAIMACATAFGQDTNSASPSNFSYFRIITERNIFNPDRYPNRARGPRGPRGPATDAFALVGTMSYEKGQFAFFDGTSSTYRKALPAGGTIAGYKVAEITPTAVKLVSTNKQVELKVGSQMRHEGTNWQLVARNELPTESAADTSETSGTATSTSSSGSSSSESEPNDVLKRLMQRREEDLK